MNPLILFALRAPTRESSTRNHWGPEKRHANKSVVNVFIRLCYYAIVMGFLFVRRGAGRFDPFPPDTRDRLIE